MQEKRNHYYQGKLLKSEDFIHEQSYLLHKIQNLTNLFHHSGIISGLHLSTYSNNQLILSKGYGIDETGHLIHIEEDQVFTLQQCIGFEELDSYHGYLTLHYRQQESDMYFYENSRSDTHQEFDYYIDDYTIKIQEELPINELWKTCFNDTIVYQDQDIVLHQMLPVILPEIGDMQCWYYLKLLTPMEGWITFDLKSTHYDITTQKLIFQEKAYYPVSMIRKEKIGGKICEFEITSLQIQKRDHLQDISVNIIEQVPFRKDFKQGLKDILTDIGDANHGPLVLGYIEFSYLNEQFQILKVKEIRNKSASEYLEKQLRLILDDYGYTPPLSKEEIIQEKLDNCGETRVILPANELWKSKELHHGLGFGNVKVTLGWELMEQSVIYQGNLELFHEEIPTIKYAIKIFPQKGSFQIFAKLCEQESQMVKLHWYAKKYQQEEHKQIPHLIALQPETITLSPHESCKFLPLFDHRHGNEQVEFTLEHEHAGVIQDDGTYQAPSLSGIYQIKATYELEEAIAYVRVKEKNHDSS